MQAAIRASIGKEKQSALPLAPTGGGHHLGGSSDAEDVDDLQAAIRLSLGEPPQATSSSNGGAADDPISLDNDAEEGDESTCSNEKCAASDEKEEEGEESKRKHLRLAHLSRLAGLWLKGATSWFGLTHCLGDASRNECDIGNLHEMLAT